MLKTTMTWLVSLLVLSCVNAVPARASSDDSLVDLGFLDVTQAPYNADPSGQEDAADAISRAIADARDRKLVCFFPEGTYLVSHSLLGLEINRKTEPCILVGSTKGKRPLIRLAKGAAAFQNPAKPRPVIWLWAFPGKGEHAGSYLPEHEKCSASFNQMVKGIDLDISGNPGAIGIRNAGSQGCTLEDITVTAHGAFAGFSDPPGQGGGAYNLEVIGGEYGLWITKDCRYPLINGIVLRDQKKAAIHYDHGFPMVLTAFHIIKQQAPAIVTTQASTGHSLVDGIVELKQPGAMYHTELPQTVYMKDVYLHGVTQVSKHSKVDNLAESKQWTHIREYASCHSGSVNCINGTIAGGPEICDRVDCESQPSYTDIRKRHIWDEQDIPSFEDPDAVNIKSLGAKGDGITDDTEVFKKAIAEHRKIFLPKGVYLVSDTITLGPQTQLFGAARLYTVIKTKQGWGQANTPVIDTVDDKNAACYLGFLSIVITEPYFSVIEWKAGRNSMARNVHAAAEAKRGDYPISIFRITGSGGGKWYAVNGYGAFGKRSTHPAYRRYLIQGTTEPFNIYALNAERQLVSPQSEIVDSSNVRLFYFKSEAMSGSPSIPFRIKNSHNIEFYGLTGNITLRNGAPLIDIVDCDNTTVTQVYSWKHTLNFYSLRERYGNDTLVVPSAKRLGLFKREESRQRYEK